MSGQGAGSRGSWERVKEGPSPDRQSEVEPTYEVQGGQGHRIIGRGLTFTAAQKLAREFDEGCAKYGLNTPPTRIVQDGWR